MTAGVKHPLSIVAIAVLSVGCAAPGPRFKPNPRGPCRPSAYVTVAEHPELDRPYDLDRDGLIELAFQDIELRNGDAVHVFEAANSENALIP